jgi:hypothetical protein
MAIYESEHTRFMRELMAQKPQLVQEQKKGRAMWWDRKPNPDEDRRNEESEVRMQAYVYQVKV